MTTTPPETPMTDWHRLFGMTIMDYFIDTPYHVELEKELCQKKQRVDVIILEHTPGQPLSELPDGLDNLGKHNLLTYKSHHQPMDSWAIEELFGHYVNYRKQESPSPKKLIPRKHFRLYAACARFPQKLNREVTLTELQTGVYETIWGPHQIRVMVLSEIPQTPNNTLWHLFSGVMANVEYARDHHPWHDPSNRRYLEQLCQNYTYEGVLMSYTLQDMKRDNREVAIREFKEHMDEYLRAVPPAEIAKRLSPDDLVKWLPSKEIVKRLSPADRLQGLSPADRLQGLSPKVIEAYLAKRKQPTLRKTK